MPEVEYLNRNWSLELGAQVSQDSVIHFKVWAPSCSKMTVQTKDGKTCILKKGDKGYFQGSSTEIKVGDLYKYQIDEEGAYPDPVSRYLPEGADGYSQIIDPTHFQWTDEKWPGIELYQQVIYEIHIGCFTREGTFDAAAQELEELKKLGVTLIEIMPIAEFPGNWNQGYDGVSLYAPFHGYGDHDALKRFVNKAHQLGLGVILDLVYNHFGPLYNYLAKFSKYYFSKKYDSEWGEVLNLDEEGSKEVREYIIPFM